MKERNIALIEELRSQPSENSLLEFKKNNFHPKTVGKLCSALAALMRRMNLCEEQGSGLDKVISSIELFQLPPPKFQAEKSTMQITLYAPRSFANMTIEERVRACYQHAVMKYLSGERMKNASLCDRFGIEQKNAAQASKVISAALQANFIHAADPEHPRAGYLPVWA